MKYYIHGSAKFGPKVYASSQKHVHTSQIQEARLGQNSSADLHVHVLTVGGIKTVTFPFRSVPFKRNAFRAVHRSISVSRAQAAN